MKKDFLRKTLSMNLSHPEYTKPIRAAVIYRDVGSGMVLVEYVNSSTNRRLTKVNTRVITRADYDSQQAMTRAEAAYWLEKGGFYVSF